MLSRPIGRRSLVRACVYVDGLVRAQADNGHIGALAIVEVVAYLSSCSVAAGCVLFSVSVISFSSFIIDPSHLHAATYVRNGFQSLFFLSDGADQLVST